MKPMDAPPSTAGGGREYHYPTVRPTTVSAGQPPVPARRQSQAELVAASLRRVPDQR